MSRKQVLVPDDVGVREFLQQTYLSHDAVLVHIIFIDLDHHHLPTGAVHHLKCVGKMISG